MSKIESSLKAKDLLHAGPAWTAAVLTTTVSSFVIQSWRMQSIPGSLGGHVLAGAALDPGLHDLAGFIVPMLLVPAFALAAVFLAASLLSSRMPQLPAIVWPLSGALTVGGTLGLMHAQLPTSSLARTPGADGCVMFCLAGALGGLVFAWLQPNSARI